MKLEDQNEYLQQKIYLFENMKDVIDKLKQRILFYFKKFII
jgi:hypothetical protein